MYFLWKLHIFWIAVLKITQSQPCRFCFVSNNSINFVKSYFPREIYKLIMNAINTSLINITNIINLLKEVTN